MISHRMGKRRADVGDAQYIDQEFGKFVHPGNQRTRRFQQRRLARQQVGIKHLDHARTRTRWHDQRSAGFVRGQEAGGQLARLTAHPLVECRLAAAKRLPANDDLKAEAAQHGPGCGDCAGKELLAKAGRKQRDFVHPLTAQPPLCQTITMCNWLGPWTPMTIRFSISAVRLGPVIITMGCALAACGPTMRSTAARSGRMRAARSITILIGGSSDSERGRAASATITKVPLEAMP